MQFRGKKILVYYEPQYTGSKSLQLLRSANMKNQQKTAYSGRLTNGAKKRLSKAISLLVQGTRKRWILNPVNHRRQLHQLTFVTLTISDHEKKLSGKEAHKLLLSPFLDWLRKTKKVNTYVWKAELHKASGQIHYHITTPDFIHWRELRDKWNEIQKKNGFLDAYFKKHKHYDANSTDVHKVYKIKDVEAYLIKEIAKGIQNAMGLGGKVWDCSDNLKRGKYHSTYMREKHYNFMEMACNEQLADKFVGEQFVIYNFKEPPQEYLLNAEEFKKYRTWLTVLQDSIVYHDPYIDF